MLTKAHRVAFFALPLLCMLSFSRASLAVDASDYAATPLNAGDVKAQLQTYFFDAARADRRDMLQAFITAGYDLDTRDGKGYTALILAAYNGHSEVVELLINAGADSCAEDRRGNTALMGAIFKGELAIARRLINTACSPDQANGVGQTPAMYAALFGRVELLKELQARGADLQATDIDGNSVEALARGEIKTRSIR